MSVETQFLRTEESTFPVLVIRGRLATRDVVELETQLLELEKDTEDCALVDLRECAYITSRGFPLFLHAHKALSAEGRHLFLAVSQEVRELFAVLKLHTRLNLHESRADCVAAARGARGMLPRG